MPSAILAHLPPFVPVRFPEIPVSQDRDIGSAVRNNGSKQHLIIRVSEQIASRSPFPSLGPEFRWVLLGSDSDL